MERRELLNRVGLRREFEIGDKNEEDEVIVKVPSFCSTEFKQFLKSKGLNAQSPESFVGGFDEIFIFSCDQSLDPLIDSFVCEVAYPFNR